jgi:hypothetical protein
MASTPDPSGNQAWRFINQPLTSGIILLALGAIFTGIVKISSQLNELSDKQREGLIEVRNLTLRVDRIETTVKNHEKDIILMNYKLGGNK